VTVNVSPGFTSTRNWSKDPAICCASADVAASTHSTAPAIDFKGKSIAILLTLECASGGPIRLSCAIRPTIARLDRDERWRLEEGPPSAVDPDTEQSQVLRRRDIPLEVVADHPRIGGINLQFGERPLIHPSIRLSVTQLPFYEDCVEQVAKLEPSDLFSLGRAGAVRQKRKPAARRS
jgi:hypothetical protein